MYLKGSKWSMQKRRKPLNWFRIAVLLLIVGIAYYVQLFIVPTIPTPFLPTPTATRNPESYLSEAEQLIKEGKFAPAVDAYQSAVASRPNDPAVYIALARTQIFLGRYADAQASAENALLLSPNNSTAHALRGWAIASQGDTLAAETPIKRAIELDPNNPLGHAFYAELLATQYLNGSGPFDVIERMSEESKLAIELGKDVVEAHRARGFVLYATGNYADAVREYQAAITINANISDLHLALGRCYRALGVYDEAVTSLTKANALNPSDPTPDFLIARTYATVGEFTKAEQYAEQAVKDEPANPFWRGLLGVLYYRNFKYPEAITELGYVVNGGTLDDGREIKPLELTNDPIIADYFVRYGLVLARSERCADALFVFQRILGQPGMDDNTIFNANEGIRICAEMAGTPSAPAESTPENTPETPLEATPTP